MTGNHTRLEWLEAMLAEGPSPKGEPFETRLEGDRSRPTWGGLPLTTVGTLHPDAAWLLIEAIVRAKPSAQAALARNPIILAVSSKIIAGRCSWITSVSSQQMIKIQPGERELAASYVAAAGLPPAMTDEAFRHGTSRGNDGGWRITSVMPAFRDPRAIAQAMEDPSSTDDLKEARAMLAAHRRWRGQESLSATIADLRKTFKRRYDRRTSR